MNFTLLFLLLSRLGLGFKITRMLGTGKGTGLQVYSEVVTLGLGSCWTRIYSEIRGGAKEGNDNYR